SLTHVILDGVKQVSMHSVLSEFGVLALVLVVHIASDCLDVSDEVDIVLQFWPLLRGFGESGDKAVSHHRLRDLHTFSLALHIQSIEPGVELEECLTAVHLAGNYLVHELMTHFTHLHFNVLTYHLP